MVICTTTYVQLPCSDRPSLVADGYSSIGACDGYDDYYSITIYGYNGCNNIDNQHQLDVEGHSF